MRTSVLSVVALGVFSIGFMFASVVSNGKREKVEQSYQSKIDSLGLVIKDRDWQIEQLEDGISEREAEISYWGRKYDSLRSK
jgi:peptidoglycan hydrolase CwlO-like protein